MEKIKETVLMITPRILGFVNRNRESETYGCADRYFWHYRIYDFSNARFQECCLLLTLLYLNDFEENIYFRKNKIFEWLLGIISFWCLRNRKGFLEEVYPYERSFCATAFSFYAVTESLLLLLDCAGEDKVIVEKFIGDRKIIPKLEKTGQWLSRNINKDVSNQRAAVLLGLLNISLLTGNSLFRKTAKNIFSQMKLDFKQFGYLPEYGGFDIGYSSITNSCLAHYFDKTGDQEALNIILKINKTMENSIDADGNYAGTPNSRNTQFLYVYGFVKGKSVVLDRILNGISSNSIITPLWLDDRYCIAMAVDYLYSYLSLPGKIAGE